MKTALYGFSGDPITFGHIDIIKRAANVFDKVIVGIGINPNKQYTFSLEERTEMARRSLFFLKNVDVVSFQGLLIDFAYENDVSVIVKGVRNSADFNYENVLHLVGESQRLGIDTHILFAKPELAHISSSVVKSIQAEQGLIHEYVPLYVKQCLEIQVSGQYIVGISGEIGAGKSYVCQRFCEIGKKKGIEVHHIEMDHISHRILSDLEAPAYEKLRAELEKTFGKEIRSQDGSINRKILGEIVFNDPTALEKLNNMMRKALFVRLRRELYGKKGLILINAALIAESEMSYLSNNNVLIVKIDKETQKQRLLKRELDIKQIERRLASQYSFAQKCELLEKQIAKDNQGQMWLLDNSENAPLSDIENIFSRICNYLQIQK